MTLLPMIHVCIYFEPQIYEIVSENYNGKKVNFKTYEKIVDNEIVQAKKSTTQMYSICINRL